MVRARLVAGLACGAVLMAQCTRARSAKGGAMARGGWCSLIGAPAVVAHAMCWGMRCVAHVNGRACARCC